MRIAGYHSPRTRGGMLRIKEILAPNYDIGVEPPTPNPDAVILHNLYPKKSKIPTIVYLCEERAEKVSRSLSLQKQVGRYATEVWVNCRAGQDNLRAVGIPSQLMYRPNKLIFPESPPEFTENKRLLWYWVAGQQKYENIRVESAEAIEELGKRGWKIHYIASVPIGEPPLDAPFTEVVGKIHFPHVLPDVRGMVQINTCRGIGRSCFQVLAFGHPVIGMNLDDVGFHSLCMADNWADRIEHAMEERVPHEWVEEQFSEKALNERWVERLEDVIG